ncbi:hypothetical protein [Brevibacterium album]|uniref:hypothetical protein n=1 Tax=Brevibacterium album TaxID=417948 RepID=UPI000424316D|nr:hypothetical protein [Brevibacterium album]
MRRAWHLAVTAVLIALLALTATGGPASALVPASAASVGGAQTSSDTASHAQAAPAEQASPAEPGAAAAPSEPSANGGAAEDPERRPVVLLGFAGLTFEDVDPDRTPHLWRMVAGGSVGTMTPRSVRDTSCAADGWLGVASGRRAADEPRPTCRVLADPIGGWVPDWDIYLAQAAADNYTPAVGALTEAAEAADVKVRGIGPGAAIGTASPAGRTGSWEPLAQSGERGTQVVAAADAAEIVLVDLGSVYAPGHSVTDLDAAVGEVLDAADAVEGQAPTVIAASLADGRTDESRMQFTAVLSGTDATGAASGADGAELLTSASTRQPGLVQVSDLAPTLLTMAGAESGANFAGAPMHFEDGPAGAQPKHQLMLDRQTAVLTQQSISAWMYAVWGVLLLASLLVGVVAARRTGTAGVSTPLTVGGLFFAALPVSTYLVNVLPWERSTSPDVAMLGGVIGWATVLTALALLGPWTRLRGGRIAFVSAVTLGVLVFDVATGSRLQMSTMLGEPLLIASRFYGIGNSALALYCTALLVLLGVACSWLTGTAERRRRWLTTAVVVTAVLASCALLAAPGLGTKFGSVPTLVLGTAVFALTAAGIRLSWKRLLVFGGGAGALMLAVLFLDWLRPAADRTHFGRFFDSLLSGEAGAVLLRKIGMNVDILTQSWMTVLLPLAVAAVLWAAISPARFRIPGLAEQYRALPLLRPALISLAVLLAVGTFINDSGIVVPAVGMLFLVPVLAASAAEGVREPDVREPGVQEPLR